MRHQAADSALEPLFLALGEPPLSTRFALLHRPAGRVVGLVVQAPAFAEEMNKSRRMVALQARALCAQGHAVLQLDLLGCGDSDGDLADASWQRWVQDLVAAARWLQDQVGRWTGPEQSLPPLTLWGHRAGALLAVEAAAQLPDVKQLLLWQPPASGKPLLQQFLRLAVAAKMLGGRASGGMDELRTRLASGQTVEIAGYHLPANVALGMEAARLAPGHNLAVRRVIWLEVSPRDTPELSPASAAPIASWRQTGCEVLTGAVQGPAFWQTTEIEDAPALIDATLGAMAMALPEKTSDPGDVCAAVSA